MRHLRRNSGETPGKLLENISETKSGPHSLFKIFFFLLRDFKTSNKHIKTTKLKWLTTRTLKMYNTLEKQKISVSVMFGFKLQ